MTASDNRSDFFLHTSDHAVNTRREDNLSIHPRLDRGRAALQDRLAGQFRMLAEQLAVDRLAAIAAIKGALANLERHQADAPAGMTDKLIGHFRLALSETEAIDPTCEPEPGAFGEIARRLERLTELPRAYLVLSRDGPAGGMNDGRSPVRERSVRGRQGIVPDGSHSPIT